MIRWSARDDGEGIFCGSFFRNDENGDELVVYADSGKPDFKECAEKCVGALNELPKSVVEDICEGLIRSAEEEGGVNEDFELSTLEEPMDILDYWWFVALYVDMGSLEDTIAYAVEGEGEWGENVGFVIDGGRVTYIGTDYLEHMKNAG